MKKNQVQSCYHLVIMLSFLLFRNDHGERSSLPRHLMFTFQLSTPVSEAMVAVSTSAGTTEGEPSAAANQVTNYMESPASTKMNVRTEAVDVLTHV